MFPKILSLFMSSMLATTAFIPYATPDTNDTESARVQEAKTFITQKGFYMGNTISVTVDEETIVFTVQYLTSGEYSTISYTQVASGTTITIDEGRAVDVIEYKNDGRVYIDGERLAVLENTEAGQSRAYASVWAVTSPAGANNSYPDYYGYYSNYVSTGALVKTMTANALATILNSVFGIQSSYTILDDVAEWLISEAISASLNANSVQYSGPIYRNTASSPNYTYYKYYIAFSLPGDSVVHHKRFYRTDYLV